MCCTKDLYKDDPEVWYASSIALKIDYKLGPVLGEGMFARVYRVERSRDGRLFAAKVFKKRATISEGNEVSLAPPEEKLRREVDVLRRLGGASNCLALRGILETATELYVLTELCAGGELMEHLETLGKFTEADASRYFSHVAGALAHCHASKVAHRDVKPENILVAYAGRKARAVLSDFGSAAVFSFDAETGAADRYRSEHGSPFWSSPEAWKLDYDYRADCYSAGVILLVLVAGMVDANDVRVLHGDGLGAMFGLRAKYGTGDGGAALSEDVRALLGRLLVGEGARSSMADALRSPWLTRSPPGNALSNPAAAVLRLQKADRSCRVALATLLDDAGRAALRDALAPVAGLPGSNARLGDILRALPAGGPCALVLAGLDVGGDADFVVVERPFALSKMHATTTKPRAPPRPGAPGTLKRALSRSSNDLAGMVDDPDKDRTLERVRKAPASRSISAALDARSMDGTYTGIPLFFDAEADSPAKSP